MSESLSEKLSKQIINKESFFNELNDAQRLAALNDINSCTKIVAGAGCGKTKVISSRFLKLALDLINENVESPLEKILVITFTDKASNEMKERIHQALSANGIDYYLQNLWISTFHGFCSKILRKHSIEVGLMPNFKLGDEKTLKEIYETIIEKIKNSNYLEISEIAILANNLGLSEEILSVENFKCLGAIGDLNDIFEMIFGVIKKIKSLGISPLEFLEKTTYATKKFSDKIKKMPFNFETKEDYIEAWAEHLKNNADVFCDFKNAFEKIAGKKLILDKNGSRKAKDYGYASGFPENIEHIEKIELFLVQTIALIYSIYENELLNSTVIDFDDLINKTISIFKNNSEIRAYYQNQFRHIIIDEFQDTNGAQLELIKLLLDKNAANITFVGDRKQSIYGFRHAQSENLEVLHDFIEEKYGQKYPEIMLNINYRSTSGVLGVVNTLTRDFLNLDEELTPNPYMEKGADSEKLVFKTVFDDIEDSNDLKVKQAVFIADEIAKLKAKHNPKYSDFAILVNSHKEAEFIEKFLLRANIPSVKKDNTGFFENQIAKNLNALLKLIYNENDELALIRTLKIKSSDKEIYEIAKLFEKTLLTEMEQEEFKKLNFAQKLFICHKKYNDSFKTLTSAPYIDKIVQTLNSIKKNEKIISIFYKLITNIELFCPKNEYEIYRNQIDLKTFEKIIENYSAMSERSKIRGNFASERMSYNRRSPGYENSRQNPNLRDFLNYLDSISKDINFELPNFAYQNMDAVNILTVYASKGLEFDYVFCTCINSKKAHGAGEGIIFDLGYGKKEGFGIIASKFIGKDTPKALLYKEIWKNPRDENEKLRLFYVAISRAKKYLNVLSFDPYKNVKPAYYVDVIAQ